jgi:hypothetical protein
MSRGVVAHAGPRGRCRGRRDGDGRGSGHRVRIRRENPGRPARLPAEVMPPGATAAGADAFPRTVSRHGSVQDHFY